MATWSRIGISAVKVTGLSGTESAPTDPADGLAISGLRSFALTLECDVGQTFASSAGQLDVYWYDPLVGAWSFVAEASKFIPPEASGKRRVTMVLDVLNPRGSVVLLPNGIVLSAGSLTAFYAPVSAGGSGGPV